MATKKETKRVHVSRERGLGVATMLAGVVSVCLFVLGGVSPAQAFTFDILDGEVTGALDSTVSYSTGVRTTNPKDKDDLVGQTQRDWTFDQWDQVSNRAKILSELELKWQNYGFFGRGYAFYDSVYVGDSAGRAGYPMDDGHGNDWSDEAEDYAGRRAELLDFYVYGNYDLGETPVSLRLGNQAFNWGEGTFYVDGVNTTNPLNILNLSLPGAEIKEGTIPLWAASAQFGVTENLSIDGYYQFNWEAHVLPPVGTFYGEDILGPGGVRAVVYNPQVAGAVQLAQMAGVFNPIDPIGYDPANGIVRVTTRSGDQDAKDEGQFGVSARYYLGDVELGGYFVNYHSQFPMVRVDIPDALDAATLGAINAFATAAAPGLGMTVQQVAGAAILGAVLPDNDMSLYYPEDNKMLGVSAVFPVGDYAIASEVAFHPNAPVMKAHPNDFLAEELANLPFIGMGMPYYSNLLGKDINPGETVDLTTERDTWHVSSNVLKSFGANLGFDSHILLIAAGADILPGNRDLASKGGEGVQPDKIAWGYTLKLDSTLFSVMQGLDLVPGVTFQHDVSGNSHFWGNFQEDRYRGQVRMVAKYMDNWDFNLNYSLSRIKENTKSNSDTINLVASYKF